MEEPNKTSIPPPEKILLRRRTVEVALHVGLSGTNKGADGFQRGAGLRHAAVTVIYGCGDSWTTSRSDLSLSKFRQKNAGAHLLLTPDVHIPYKTHGKGF